MATRNGVSALLILLIFLVSTGCSLVTDKVGPDKDTIKIGVIFPLTGNSAAIGDDMKNGVILAAKSFPGATMIFEDSKGAAKDMVTAYHKLTQDKGIDVLLAAFTGVDAIIPLAQQDKIPLFLTGSSASGATAYGDYIFRYFTNADIDAPVLAKYATAKLGLRRFVVLRLQDQFSIDYSNVFAAEVEKVGGKVIATEDFQYSSADYRTQLVKLRQQKFDGIYLIGLDYQLLIALKQIRELNFPGTILAVGTIATRDALTKAGDSAEGIYTSAFCVDEKPAEYLRSFRQEFGSDPGFFSEMSYDAVRLIKQAAKTGQDRESIRRGLAVIKDFPALAGRLSADASGEMVVPMCAKKIRGGKIYNLVTGKYSDY